MSGINKCIFIGRLGQDPESKFMPNGDAVTNISIAISESWTDKNTGDKKEKTEWIRIVAFRRLAEIMSEYLKKGSNVYIEGKMTTRKWDKDGQTHYSTEIVASQLQMLDSRGDNQQSQPAQQSAPQVTKVDNNFDNFEDDIPF